MYIILAILAFGVLVFVHELGHFTLAKINGVKVEEFAIGMGPKIISKQYKETKYSLRILPIGGYVKMLGEEDESDDPDSFSAKSPLRRITIIVAGVIMNYILAICIFTAIIYNFGYVTTEVGNVDQNSPAYNQIVEGDKFLKINGLRVFSQQDISMGVQLSNGNPMEMTIERDGQKKELIITPKKDENNQYKIGVAFEGVQNPGLLTSFKEGFKETASCVMLTYKQLGMMLKGQINFKTDVGGPVTIIKMSAATAKAGIWNLANFTAFLSVNLAVFNLLPFPALDGGWTVILLIELITRRKVPDKIVGALNYFGFIVLIGLMILVTAKELILPINIFN